MDTPSTESDPVRILAASNRFYIGLSLLVTAIAFAGFWPTYFGPLFAGTVDKLPVIHFHAAVYVGWLAIFIAQATFAATKRMDLHVRLGNFAIGYGVLVIVMGVTVAISMFAVRVHAGNIEEAEMRLVARCRTWSSSRRCSPRRSDFAASPRSTND